MSSENECVLNLMFRNSTENCRKKLLKINHDAWLETGQSNVREYATPNELKVNIFHGDNHTSLTIRGTGQMRLTPGMIIKTRHIKIEYVDTKISENVSIRRKSNYAIMNFTWDEHSTKLIPALGENMSKISCYDRKKLFDLGVDVDVLKIEKPFLENLFYSPLSSGLTIATVGTGALIMLVFLIVNKHLGEMQQTCNHHTDQTPSFQIISALISRPPSLRIMNHRI